MSDRPAWHHVLLTELNRLKWFILLLAVLSVGDVLVTRSLLNTSSRFYESNPLARWLFTRYNFAGMVGLKLAGVSLAVLISLFVEHFRPHYGKFVLIVGIVVTAYVVYIGLDLYYHRPL